MRVALLILIVAGLAALTAAPAVATPDVLGDSHAPAYRDRIERPTDNSWSNADDSDSITEKDLAVLPQAFIQAARLGELGAACKWGANQDERATARDRLLWAAAAIARRVGVSPKHTQSLIEAFSYDAEILAPIQADVANSIKNKHACEDDTLRATWEASAFLGSKRI